MDFGDILSKVGENKYFEEIPVTVREFVQGDQYLSLNKGADPNFRTELSDYQYKIIEASSQFLDLETLKSIHSEKEAKRIFSHTFREVVLELGKGSGKDFCSTISCCYAVYVLLCLKDPAMYFRKPRGDAIDIINIAVNAEQAKNVFFKGFQRLVEGSEWFAGKYTKYSNYISFDKNVTVFSGHSERESFEGYNLILAFLDEISGFATKSSGSESTKTAESIYTMFKQSVVSRFPDVGKVVSLSFPREKGDFIDSKYNELVKDKEVVKKEHTFKLIEDLPDGLKDNEFSISWEEDIIKAYAIDKVWCLKRPSWVINPTKKIDDYKDSFYSDPVDTLMRFACMPPDATDAYFPSREKIEKAYRLQRINVDADGIISKHFKPNPDKQYFIHVDLAQKHDRCVVSMAHVESWQQRGEGENFISPKIVVDFIRYWIPTRSKSVDFREVKRFILDIYKMGFDIKLCTFDRWNSFDMMKELESEGMKVENLSIKKDHYDDYKLAIMEERLTGPYIPLLIDEMVRLRIIKGKVDHPPGGFNDLSDSTCGAIFNAITHTERYSNHEVEVYSIGDMQRLEDEKYDGYTKKKKKNDIDPPQMPKDIEDFLANIAMI